MKISELQPNQGNIDVTVEVVSVEEPRTFNKYGRDLKVANAIVKDDSGEIKLTLWNDDIEKVKQGMTLHIENGYCSELKDEKQLTTGKFGKFEVLGGEEKKAPIKSKEPEEPYQEPEEQFI